MSDKFPSAMIIYRKKNYSDVENLGQPDLSKNNPAEQEALIRQIKPGVMPKTPNENDGNFE